MRHPAWNTCDLKSLDVPLRDGDRISIVHAISEPQTLKLPGKKPSHLGNWIPVADGSDSTVLRRRTGHGAWRMTSSAMLPK